MIGFILYLFVIGIVAGYVARAVVPGPDPMSFWQTVLLGVAGSFVGGFLGGLLFGGDTLLGPAGFIGSIIGAVIALLIYRAMGGRTRTGARGTTARERDRDLVR